MQSAGIMAINNSEQCMKELLTGACQSLKQAAAWEHARAWSMEATSAVPQVTGSSGTWWVVLPMMQQLNNPFRLSAPVMSTPGPVSRYRAASPHSSRTGGTRKESAWYQKVVVGGGVEGRNCSTKRWEEKRGGILMRSNQKEKKKKQQHHNCHHLLRRRQGYGGVFLITVEF